VPVIVRIRDDAVCLDLRTLHEPDFDTLVSALLTAATAEDDEPDTEGPARASV
jgi:hypothetical protein